jgi:pilus retraction protein PilT
LLAAGRGGKLCDMSNHEAFAPGRTCRPERLDDRHRADSGFCRSFREQPFQGLKAGSLPQALEALCEAAASYDASDLLFHEGHSPQLRVGGSLTLLDFAPLDGAFFDALWMACGAREDTLDHDASLTSGGGVRFRVNLLRQLGRRAAVLRRIRGEIPELEALGLPADLLRNWAARQAGLVLVCGPAGSGKSTTLAATLEWMNQRFSRHVVTIEDPIEYLFSNQMSLFTQREVGIDTPSFAEGLRRSLRQNPDVIFVGEIRDVETATTAIQACETGHLVLATLHSSSCSDAIERLQLLFPAASRDAVRRALSAQLVGVLCQRLLPALPAGVVLAAEYFSNIGAMRKYVADGQMPELADAIARSDPQSAQNFVLAVSRLVQAHRVAEDVAAAASDNPQELKRALRGISSASQATRR